MEEHFETCSNVTKKESNVTEIETTLLQIASGLQSAAGAHMTLASHIYIYIKTLQNTTINYTNTTSSYPCSYAYKKSANC